MASASTGSSMERGEEKKGRKEKKEERGEEERVVWNMSQSSPTPGLLGKNMGVQA